MAYAYSDLIKESGEELLCKQRSSSKVIVFQRLQMLRLLKSSRANTLVAAAPLVGATERSLQRWWKQYRQQGLQSLLEVAPTRQSRLSQEQQQALMEQAGKGDFSTINEIVDWVEQSFGIHYTQVGMWKLVKRLKIKKKTARPSHVLKDKKAAERFKKTSLSC